MNRSVVPARHPVDNAYYARILTPAATRPSPRFGEGLRTPSSLRQTVSWTAVQGMGTSPSRAPSPRSAELPSQNLGEGLGVRTTTPHRLHTSLRLSSPL